MIKKSKYDSWLKTHIYQHIPYIDEVNELQDILQRSHLLKQYQSNQAYQCIQHYFLWNQCIQHCKLNVHVLQIQLIIIYKHICFGVIIQKNI